MRMRAQMLRAVVTLVAQKGGNVLRAPCTLLRVRDGRVQKLCKLEQFSWALATPGGKDSVDGTVPVKVFLRVRH